MPLTKAKTDIIDLNKDTTINTISLGLGGGAIATNMIVGFNALLSNTTGSGNIAVGYVALQQNTIGAINLAIGGNSLSRNIQGNSNVAIGNNSLADNVSGHDNTAVGSSALELSKGNKNTAVGFHALEQNLTANDNTAVGSNALGANTTGQKNTAVGRNALVNNTAFSNVGGFGYDAQVSGSNQIRIGDTNITSVTCQTNAWSDERDKTDIRNTVLGLDFVKLLRPVDFKWDYREDYRPQKPIIPSENASQEEKAAYNEAKAKWIEDCKWANLVHDGTHKRTRFHHGLIAQEVKSLIEQTGVDFGGFQDHTVAGGDAVMTIGYTELIGPMIKAIQELSAEVKTLKDKLKDQ